MKRCPECRRDYYDDTLLYCLDDGSALLDGPGSSGGEPPTDDGEAAATLPFVPVDSRGGAAGEHTTVAHIRNVRKSGRSKAVVAAFILVIIGGVSFGVYKYISVVETVPAPHFRAIKLSRATNEGNVHSATISPDGRYIAYVTVDGPVYRLWTKHLATNSSVQIAAPIPAEAFEVWAVAFTPDSNYILYAFPTSIAGYDVFRIPVLGGAPRKLLSNIFSSVYFSPDGRLLSFARLGSEAKDSSLHVANADGSNERLVIKRSFPAIIGADGSPWLPDGSGLLTTLFAEPTIFSVALADPDADLKPLMSKKFNAIGASIMLPDGRGIVFAAQEQASEANKLWYLPYPAGDPRVITSDLNSFSIQSLSVTADGQSLLSIQEQSPSSIDISDKGQPGSARRVSARTGTNDGVWGLSWDRSGRLFWVSQDENKSETWTIGPDSPAPKIVMNEAALASVTVTPDGKYLVFVSKRSGDWQIWRADTDGGGARELTPRGLSVAPGISVSQDSRWVLYSTQVGVRKVSIDGGEQIDLVKPAAFVVEPKISPDGTYLSVAGLDAANTPSIWVYRLESDQPRLVKTLSLPATFENKYRWASDSKSFIYCMSVGRVSNLWQLPLDEGKPRQVTNFTSERIRNFAYSHDGKQLALAHGPVTSDAVLITEVK